MRASQNLCGLGLRRTYPARAPCTVGNAESALPSELPPAARTFGKKSGGKGPTPEMVSPTCQLAKRTQTGKSGVTCRCHVSARTQAVAQVACAATSTAAIPPTIYRNLGGTSLCCCAAAHRTTSHVRNAEYQATRVPLQQGKHGALHTHIQLAGLAACAPPTGAMVLFACLRASRTLGFLLSCCLEAPGQFSFQNCCLLELVASPKFLQMITQHPGRLPCGTACAGIRVYLRRSQASR
jgi:hypothetical protein